MKPYVIAFLSTSLVFATTLVSDRGSAASAKNDVPMVVTTELGFDNRDIRRLSTAEPRNKIDNESVPTFVLGTIINVIDSTYSNTPIFNLGNLNEESLLDLNAQSASQDDLRISMTTNKSAATTSHAVSVDANASANFGGVFGASAAAHFDFSLSLAHSDGNVYVTMSRGKHGSYFQINTKDLKSGIDFTPYLIGTELTYEEVQSYISYETKREGGIEYIQALNFGGVKQSGLIDWDRRNYYGNVQLLTEMESVFALLLKQYRIFEANEAIRNILCANMVELKAKIDDAVQDFYAHVGTHFVTRLNFANYAYGYGTLHFDESSGNEESRYGVAASINGGIPSKFAGQAGGSVTYAQKYGWAQAMKDLHIEAQARPSGIVDIMDFGAQIGKMLNDESKPLSVPNLSVPASPKVEVSKIPDLKKKRQGPPDSVFSSYDDWKKYQADLKKDKGGKDKLEDKIDKINADLRKRGVGLLLEKDEDARNLYAEFTTELESRKKDQVEEMRFKGGSNILRIDDMFVSGYEITPYEAVIPSLRTAKIALPGQEEQINTYPNVTKLLLVVNLFRQLADYTNFLSKFVVSNVSDDFSSAIEQFRKEFAEKGQELVVVHMSAGIDIKTEVLRDFAESMYGGDQGAGMRNSQLFKMLGSDVDRFNYVMYLLNPEVSYLWRDAPGGYAPFFFDKDGSLRFVGLKKLQPAKVDYKKDEYCLSCQYALELDLSKPISDTPKDIAKLYEGRTESPLYPVFRYEQRNNPKLLFLQLAGRYQLIYGKNGLIYPYLLVQHPMLALVHLYPAFWINLDKYTISLTTGDLVREFSLKPADPTYNKNIQVMPNMDETVTNALMQYIQGFDINGIDNSHALYYPNKTQTEELREANRVLLYQGGIHDRIIKYECTPLKLLEVDTKLFHLLYVGYAFNDRWHILQQQFAGRTGELVSIESGSKAKINGDESFFALLPIDYTKVAGGYGSLLMGGSFGVNNLIGNPTYDAGIITSIHN
jgi:hypothetical protein